jgi:colanic acid biosynthesis glycosyl transferase WcaI
LPRILISTQVFPPEIHPTAVMVCELAGHLAQHGWEVEVVCGFPHHPAGVLPEGWTKSLWRAEDQDGFRVLRTWHVTSSSRSIPARAGVYVSQALGTTAGAMLSPKADVVLVYGPPLVGPDLGALVAFRHGAKLANVVYDIYPDIAVETGRVTNPAVIRAARLAERFQYWASDLTIVLSEGFKQQLVAKGVDESRIAVVPVWLDPNEIQPLPRDNAWRREHDIPLDRFVVLYAGTIGVVSGATVVAEAAALLRDSKDILFLFVGEGDEKPSVEARARELGLTNMRFLPFQPRERLAEVQATADVGLVTLAPGRGRTSVPSKVLGYMAAGRPALASVDEGSDTAREITENEIGVVVKPGDAAVIAHAVSALKKSSGRRLSLGERARARLEREYSRESALERYRARLEELILR